MASPHPLNNPLRWECVITIPISGESEPKLSRGNPVTMRSHSSYGRVRISGQRNSGAPTLYTVSSNLDQDSFLEEGRKGSEEGVPENLSVPLEGDRDRFIIATFNKLLIIEHIFLCFNF